MLINVVVFDPLAEAPLVKLAAAGGVQNHGSRANGSAINERYVRYAARSSCSVYRPNPLTLAGLISRGQVTLVPIVANQRMATQRLAQVGEARVQVGGCCVQTTVSE